MDGGAPWSTLEPAASRNSVIFRILSPADLRSSAVTVGSADQTLIMSRLRIGARPGENSIGIEAGPASSVADTLADRYSLTSPALVSSIVDW